MHNLKSQFISLIIITGVQARPGRLRSKPVRRQRHLPEPPGRLRLRLQAGVHRRPQGRLLLPRRRRSLQVSNCDLDPNRIWYWRGHCSDTSRASGQYTIKAFIGFCDYPWTWTGTKQSTKKYVQYHSNPMCHRILNQIGMLYQNMKFGIGKAVTESDSNRIQ